MVACLLFVVVVCFFFFPGLELEYPNLSVVYYEIHSRCSPEVLMAYYSYKS